MQTLQTFSYQGSPVEFELINGQVYANATAMCKPFGKRPNDWYNLPATQRYIQAITGKSGNSDFQLFIKKAGNPEFGGGTWIHEKLILKLAQWLDVEFEIWCDEHIAQLLRTGTITLPAATSTPYYLPQTKAEALRALAEEIEAHEATQLQLAAAQPKIEHYERTMSAEGGHSISDVAKMIATSQVPCGQNRLFEFLRAQNVLFYHGRHNHVYQQYIDSGWFRVVQMSYPYREGRETYPQIHVLPKGIEGIRKKWDAAHPVANPAQSEIIPTSTAYLPAAGGTA